MTSLAMKEEGAQKIIIFFYYKHMRWNKTKPFSILAAAVLLFLSLRFQILFVLW
jgi:hypothetical protein